MLTKNDDKTGRKPKNAAPDSATNTDVAAPAPAPTKRKRTVKPKDPNAPPRQSKKKVKDSPGPTSEINSNRTVAVAVAVAGPPKQPKIIESSYQGLADQHSKIQPQPPQPHIAKDEAIHTQRPIQSFFTAPPPPPPQAPPPPPQQPQQQSQQPQPQPQPQPHSQAPLRTSGQNYDPIRSNYDPVRETVITHNHYPNSQGSPNQAPPSMNRASASPSISSLVDPPNHALTSPSIAAQSFFNQQQLRYQRDESHNSVPSSPTANRFAPSATVDSSASPKAPVVNKVVPVPVSAL